MLSIGGEETMDQWSTPELCAKQDTEWEGTAPRRTSASGWGV